MLKTVSAALIAAVVLAVAPASAGPARHHGPVVSSQMHHGKHVHKHHAHKKHVYKHRYGHSMKRHKHGKIIKLVRPHHHAHRGAIVIR